MSIEMRALLGSLALGAGCAACSSGGEHAVRTDAGAPDVTALDAADASSEETGLEPGIDSGPCSGPGLEKTWTAMDRATVTATSAAELNLASDGGLTLPAAEAVLCTGMELAPLPDGSHVEAWGNSNEVQLTYDPTSEDGETLSLFHGYLGALEFKSDPALGAQQSYVLGIGPVEKDGAPFEIDWSVTPFTAGNEIFNALMYTYGSPMGLYTGPLSMSCQSLSVCPVNEAGGEAVWSIVPLGLTFTFGSVTTQPAASTVSEIDLTVP